MFAKMDISLTGDIFTDELHTDVGAAAFCLNHDWFIDLVINTAPGGGGANLVIGVDYILNIEDTNLSGRVTDELGVSKNVWSEITIINAAYQAVDLYFSGKYIADSIEGKDVNGTVPIGVPIPWHKSLVAQGSTALKSGTATSYSAGKLVDSGGGFTGVVSIGDIVWNSTDSAFTTVTAVDSDTQLSLDWDAFDTGNEGYSIYDEPELPENWLECDGSTVDDGESPIDGLTLPDINGDERFLRGGPTAGLKQADAFQGFGIEWDIISTPSATPRTYLSGGSAASEANKTYGFDFVSDGVHGVPRIASETRPVNLSVVWIMRIK